MYKIPARDVKVGDMLIHSNGPVTAVKPFGNRVRLTIEDGGYYIFGKQVEVWLEGSNQ